MATEHVTFDEALYRVRAARPQVSTKFEEQLRGWDPTQPLTVKRHPLTRVPFYSNSAPAK